MGGWMRRRDPVYTDETTREILELFPPLALKLDVPAALLSGGQQQMLSLAMALLSKPRLVMIDELSLGLAPAVIEQLLQVVRKLRERGVTVILVEQSVNLALTVAETAYFMEKGRIQFHGSTSELLARPDILRSVFLEGATSGGESRNGTETSGAGTAIPLSRKVVLETRGLTKTFAGVVAVDDLSIDLVEGEILGVIGPNGAGKTTLFDLLSGYLVPDSGTIRFVDRDITLLRPDLRSQLGLARSFQDARLFGALTVHQTICIALDRELRAKGAVPALLSLPHVRWGEYKLGARADELIDLMRLGAFRDKFVSELSTGSRRIVDLACQVAMKPKVILFDEPSSGIAQREAEALGPLLRRIREELGASLLVIEHDMPLIRGIADRLVALDLGRRIAMGSSDEVLHHPRVVASYLGSRQDVIERSGKGGIPSALTDSLPGGSISND
jgi:branched-chain amino acid transport system ATP-binding protein